MRRRPAREASDEIDEGGPPTRLVEAAVVEEDHEPPAPTDAADAVDGPGAVSELQAPERLDLAGPATEEAPSFSVTGEAALAEVESVVDPDEELWQRWAKGSDLDVVPESRSRVLRSSKGDERRGRDWSA
jgi:hypothetical protein